MISGNLWPSKGTLTVLGKVFGATSIPDLTKRIGWVSQTLQERLPRNETAERIVLSGKFASIGIYQTYSEADLEKAEEILQSLGAAKLKGQTYGLLSQGEKQVVLIARALMAQPELLILDEPCNGLDLFAREELLSRIQQMNHAKTAPNLLYVTHHTEEILPLFDHILMIRKGKIFQQGKREALLQAAILTDFYQRPITLHQIDQDRVMVLPNRA